MVTDTEFPPPKKKSGWLSTLVFLAILLVLFGLLIPVPLAQVRDQSDRAQAKTGAVQVAIAFRQYYTEYGRWPDFTGDGKFFTAERNTRLMQVLTAHEEINNHHKIVFFE